jgi:hypothetical protein
MVPRPMGRLFTASRHDGREQVSESTEDQPGLEGGDGPPIFVIGSPRSGTTLLRLVLDSHPRISCGEETHFLRSLEAIVGRDWPLVETYGLPRTWWLARIRELYEAFQREVLAASGKARWAEKDPTYTLHLPFIEALFPNARYVHLVRDGHDVVASFRDRWGYRSAVRAARSEWARYVQAAMALGERLGPERFLEVPYEHLVADPERETRRLFAFLGEEWHASVIDFDPSEHAATERYRWFTAQRRRAGGEDGTIYRSRVGTGGRSLDPLLRSLLRRRHARLLRQLGYLEPGEA